MVFIGLTRLYAYEAFPFKYQGTLLNSIQEQEAVRTSVLALGDVRLLGTPIVQSEVHLHRDGGRSPPGTTPIQAATHRTLASSPTL